MRSLSEVSASTLPTVAPAKESPVPYRTKSGTVCIQCMSASCEHLIVTQATPRLTEQDQKIIRLLMAANAQKEIAFQLGLSQATVKLYIARIYEKLDLQGWGTPRTRLVLWGQEHAHLLALAPPPRKAA